LRFGALNPPSDGEFHGASWENHIYDVAIGPNKTALTIDGKLRLAADRSVVVRQYQPREFTIKSVGPVRVTTAEFDSGSFDLKVDGKPMGAIAVKQGRATFTLAAGEHAVQLVH
jgi:hypothetical protein